MWALACILPGWSHISWILKCADIKLSQFLTKWPSMAKLYFLFVDWNRPHNIACFCDHCTLKSRGTSKAGQTAPIVGCSITETVQNQGMASLGGGGLQGLTAAPGCFWGGQFPNDLTVALPSIIHHWWEALLLLFHSDKTCTHIEYALIHSLIQRNLFLKRWEREISPQSIFFQIMSTAPRTHDSSVLACVLHGHFVACQRELKKWNRGARSQISL